jgi:hypothetical protein
VRVIVPACGWRKCLGLAAAAPSYPPTWAAGTSANDWGSRSWAGLTIGLTFVPSSRDRFMAAKETSHPNLSAVVSYGHMHDLVLSHGEGMWASALIPLSVDGMIVASSMSLLLDSRLGRRGGMLPWVLLITGALASLAANVAVSEPTVIGRLIAAWPSFALTASYELLMRQVRDPAGSSARDPGPAVNEPVAAEASPGPRSRTHRALPSGTFARGQGLRRQAWEWALAHRENDGSLPSGKAIAAEFDRHERWGRLVKREGLAGEFTGHRLDLRPGSKVAVVDA